MAQATNRIHEPTMEEILASIRKIIADDDTATESPPPETVNAEDNSSLEELAQTSSQGLEEDDGNEGQVAQEVREDVLALNESVSIPDADIADDETTANDNRLLDEEADISVNESFQQLTQSLMSQDARTLEEMVSEMMRPMLQVWLNDNLPSLVERLVREEIERVSRVRR